MPPRDPSDPATLPTLDIISSHELWERQYIMAGVRPALFKPELLRERHPRPQLCVAALHAVGFELATNCCQVITTSLYIFPS